MVIGLGAALLAAVLFGVAAVVQAIAARRYGLVSWMMAGVAMVYLLGWLLHLVSIALVPLYVAQVGIAASLVVTAVLAATVVGEPLAPRHWVAIGAMFAGLVLLVLAAGPVGNSHFETEHTLVLYLGAALTLGLGLVARRFSGEASGVALGALAGIAYGGSPISTRALVDPRLDAETILPALTHRHLRPARVLAVLDRPASRRRHGGERTADPARDGRSCRRRDHRVRRPGPARLVAGGARGLRAEHAGRLGPVRCRDTSRAARVTRARTGDRAATG